MVNLDVQLWELGTQKLHQGLSETIHVNTLTDIREFKKYLAISLPVCNQKFGMGATMERRRLHPHFVKKGDERFEDSGPSDSEIWFYHENSLTFAIKNIYGGGGGYPDSANPWRGIFCLVFDGEN